MIPLTPSSIEDTYNSACENSTNAIGSDASARHCTYPSCNCAISFPDGYTPSDATECPNIVIATLEAALATERAWRKETSDELFDLRNRAGCGPEQEGPDVWQQLAETRALLQQAVRQTTALTEKAKAEQDRMEEAVRTMAADFLKSKGKVEALRAALEQAEVVRDAFRSRAERAEAERDALTVALAGAREALKAMVSEVRKFHPTFDARIFVQAERALSLPTTEPAKAEELP